MLVCRKILLVIGALLLLQGTYARSTRRPSWAKGYFVEAQNSYIEVVSAIGFEEDNARKKATQVLIERRGLAAGGTKTQLSMVGGEVQITSESTVLVKARVLDEYVDRIEPGRYCVYLLVQTAKNPTLPYDAVKVKGGKVRVR